MSIMKIFNLIIKFFNNNKQYGGGNLIFEGFILCLAFTFFGGFIYLFWYIFFCYNYFNIYLAFIFFFTFVYIWLYVNRFYVYLKVKKIKKKYVTYFFLKTYFFCKSVDRVERVVKNLQKISIETFVIPVGGASTGSGANTGINNNVNTGRVFSQETRNAVDELEQLIALIQAETGEDVNSLLDDDDFCEDDVDSEEYHEYLERELDAVEDEYFGNAINNLFKEPISNINTENAPVVNTENAPVVNTENAPVVNTENAPVVNTENAPVVNTEFTAPDEEVYRTILAPDTGFDFQDFRANIDELTTLTANRGVTTASAVVTPENIATATASQENIASAVASSSDSYTNVLQTFLNEALPPTLALGMVVLGTVMITSAVFEYLGPETFKYLFWKFQNFKLNLGIRYYLPKNPELNPFQHYLPLYRAARDVASAERRRRLHYAHIDNRAFYRRIFEYPIQFLVVFFFIVIIMFVLYNLYCAYLEDQAKYDKIFYQKFKSPLFLFLKKFSNINIKKIINRFYINWVKSRFKKK